MLRKELRRAVWPADHTRGGELPRGVVASAFDERLRPLVKELRDRLADVGVRGSVEDRRRDEGTSAYRLTVPPEQMRLQ